MSEKTALYRVWGKADLLLYIGISKDFGVRWKQHAKQQPWWDEMKRLTADEWFESRELAEDAETVAIRAEKPKYNIAKVEHVLAISDEVPALWVGDDDILDQVRRVATSPCSDARLIRLMLIALLEGYRELPGGRELEALAAKVGVSRSTAYGVVRKARLSAAYV